MLSLGVLTSFLPPSVFPPFPTEHWEQIAQTLCTYFLMPPLFLTPSASRRASSKHSLVKSDLKISKPRVYRVSIKSGNLGYYTEYFIDIMLQLSKIISRFLGLLDV